MPDCCPSASGRRGRTSSGVEGLESFAFAFVNLGEEGASIATGGGGGGLAGHSSLSIGDESRRAVCGSECIVLQCWALGGRKSIWVSREPETGQKAVKYREGKLVNLEHGSKVIMNIPRGSSVVCTEWS